MALAYSSYSKLIVMSLLVTRDLKYFGGKLPTDKKKPDKFGQGKYTIMQNLVALQHVCGYKYA